MQILTSLSELRTQVTTWHRAGKRVALVPTMGNLHTGHIDLVNRARSHADHVVVSVFVNPLQFGKNEDFNRYPRTPGTDADRLRAADTDVLFMPTVAEAYPQGLEAQTRIEVPGASDILCGRFRPGHFSGVATVVNMLFNMVQPDVALFGEKDYQQLFVIRCMVRDLHLPIEIVGVPTVRDKNGLALSSRNQYLTDAERRLAPVIYRSLLTTAEQLKTGHPGIDVLQGQGIQTLREAGFRPDYFEILRPDLTPPAAGERELVILVAAWLGKARLLDNLRVSF
ncbi:MAG: pantoate--beta-alanine ligase [Nevskiales bacterium]